MVSVDVISTMLVLVWELHRSVNDDMGRLARVDLWLAGWKRWLANPESEIES